MGVTWILIGISGRCGRPLRSSNTTSYPGLSGLFRKLQNVFDSLVCRCRRLNRVGHTWRRFLQFRQLCVDSLASVDFVSMAAKNYESDSAVESQIISATSLQLDVGEKIIVTICETFTRCGPHESMRLRFVLADCR